MHYCSIAYSQLGPANLSIIMVMIMLMMTNLKTVTYIVTLLTIIDGQDDDFDYMTINLNHG